MDRYWKNPYVAAGLILCAFDLMLLIPSGTRLMAVMMLIPAVLLIGAGKRQVDGDPGRQ